MQLKAEAFHSLGRLHKTSRNFILLKEIHRILQILHYMGFSNQKDNSTTRSLRFIHSSCSTHPCIFKTFQIFYRDPPYSNILQLECIFYHQLVSRKLYRVSVEDFKLQTILQTFILQRKRDVTISAIFNSFEILNMLTTNQFLKQAVND